MKKTIALTTLAGSILTLIAGNVFACEESLFKVGKGVAFREYTAPLPGSILVVANTESELALVGRLAAAGHDSPVAMDGALEISEASGLYQRSLSSEDSVLTYLKTIYRTLKSQS